MATIRDQIQADWENREFVETLTCSVKKLADFLNNFGKNFSLQYNNLMPNSYEGCILQSF